MARCGCGTECACEIEPGCGINVLGSGQPDDDPYRIGVDPSTLAGSGLKPSGQQCGLAVDLAPGGGISHDTNGALYNAEAAEEFDPSNPSIPALVSSRAKNGDIVGAYLGGYLYKPQSTRAAVHNAADRGYDLLHLPVRFLRDGTPAVTPDEYLGRQNGNTQDFDSATGVQNQTPARWRRLINPAGVERPDRGGQGKRDTLVGWFGYLESTETGLLTLAEAIDIVDKRIPMVWDIHWPTMEPGENGATWAPGHAPPPERVDAFIRHLKLLLRRNAQNGAVIVTSTHPQVPHRDGTLNLLEEVGADNVGVTLRDSDDMQRLSPDALGTSGEDSDSNGTSWVLAPKQLPADQVKQYSDAGHNVLIAPLTRHTEHENTVGPAGAVGVLSGDPEYTAGHLKTHPVYAGYPYRQAHSAFHQTVIHHGLIGPQETWFNRVHGKQRGWFPRYNGEASGGEYVIPRETGNIATPQYWVLQGWCSPVDKPDDSGDDNGHEFSLTLWLNVHRNYDQAKRLVAADVCFARDTDTPIPGDGLPAAGDKSGYVLSYRTGPSGKSLQLFTVNVNGDEVKLKDWDVSGFDNTWTAVRIRVRNEGIRVAAVNRRTGNLATEVYDTAQEQDPQKKRLGQSSRGGYIFFGRRIDSGTLAPGSDPESAGFAKVTITPGRDDTPDNPPPPDDDDGGDGDTPPPDGAGDNDDGPPPDQEEERPPPDDDAGGDNGGGGEPPPPPPEPEPETYTVQSGDTLSGIAAETGADQQAITDANDLDNPDAIQEGDVLKIPR